MQNISEQQTEEAGTEHKRRSQLMLSSLVVGASLAFFILFVNFSGKKTDFEDAAIFGAQTTSIYAKVDGYPIHCSHSVDYLACLDGMKKRKADHSVLWLGNSQVHAVNQWTEGETNAVPILFDGIKPHNLDLLTFSQANAGLQEHYVLFEYLRRKLPLKVFILPLVFDDMREEGLRNEVAVFTHDEATASALRDTEIGRRILKKAIEVPQDEETGGIAETTQEQVEKKLNTWLDENSTLWQTRPEIRGELIHGVLYTTRNTIFGIKATTKRKMIPGRYNDNMEALEAMLKSAQDNNISVVLYVAPFRGGEEHPYVEEDYVRYKSEVDKLGQQYNVVFANLESLIPEELWGVKNSTDLEEKLELDFMHFQGGGHKLLAAQLEKMVITAAKTEVIFSDF